MEGTELYYTAPSDEIFDEVKVKALQLWATYDNQFGYVDEKTQLIVNIKNVADNVMFIVAMFDSDNHRRLAEMLSQEARQALRERMIDGGNPSESIPF